MGLIEQKGVYVFEEFEELGVVAGFTDKRFAGIDIEADFKKVSEYLDITYDRIVYLEQVHSNNIVLPESTANLYKGDGLVTFRENEVLVVRTADCLPVFICDCDNRFVGMIHLGWRPAKSGIIDNFIRLAGTEWKLNFKDLFAGIGPGLRDCCFEVGEEFLGYDCFKEYICKRNGKYFLDLAVFMKNKFIQAGSGDNFLDTGICSAEDESFYSYRRNKTANRTLSFIINK